VGEHESKDWFAQRITRAAPGTVCTEYGSDPDASPVAFWSGPGYKDHLREFIAYCRCGGFQIW
jgi:hypothetical protein